LRDGARASDAGRDCARSLTARRAPGAVLRAELRAPCDPGMRVRFAHAGLRFTLVTGDDGRAAVDIPAMQTAAMVEARFADGAVLAAETAVPSAAEFDRLAVVTEGWYGLTLHARVRQGGKGHITQLGDAPRDADLVTEVFTAPSGRFGSLGGVSLELELPVNPVNCGRDIQADIIRSGEGAPVVLGLSVPSCDAVGETVVLPLRPADPRLAQNRG
jgi:hypothetical protein